VRASLVVSSAAGLGHGTLRALDDRGAWTGFGPPAIRDPRGVRRRVYEATFVVNEPFGGVWLLDGDGAVLAQIELPPGLDPGAGAFAPDGMYYVGSRAQRSLERIDLTER
jgi:hypothetical protein